MTMVKVNCKKCGESAKIDTCGKSREEVEKWLKNDTDGFNCFGNHVEFGKRSDYWIIDWSTEEEGEAMSEEEFLNELKSMYSVVLNTSDLQRDFVVKSFMYGTCIAENSGKEYVFNYTHSPKGVRYYYR